MDKLDWKIVAALERDGRQSYADLGEQVGLSKSPCWSRVKNLEESGVIDGYAARIDPIAVGLAVQSFVEVQIRFDAHTEFEAAVLAHPAVVECHTTAGESDSLTWKSSGWRRMVKASKASFSTITACPTSQ